MFVWAVPKSGGRLRTYSLIKGAFILRRRKRKANTKKARSHDLKGSFVAGRVGGMFRSLSYAKCGVVQGCSPVFILVLLFSSLSHTTYVYIYCL